MNDILQAINFKVKAVNITNGSTWSVIHPNGGLPFHDNMVIEAIDPSIDSFRVDAVLHAAQECGFPCYQYAPLASNNQRVPSSQSEVQKGNPRLPQTTVPPTGQPQKPPPTHTQMLLSSVKQSAAKQIAVPSARIPSGTSALLVPTVAPSPPTIVGDVSSKADEDEKEHDQCVICFSAKKEHVAIPCGHCILCTDCTLDQKMMKALTHCPICRLKMECVVFIG